MSRRITPQELERAGLEVLPKLVQSAVASIEGRVGIIEMCDHLLEDLEDHGNGVAVVCAEHPRRFLCTTCGAQHQDTHHPPTGCVECGQTVKLEPVIADFTFRTAGGHTLLCRLEVAWACGPCRGRISNA